ncbi:TPA: hypothetical protein ACH3X1_016063 [Trebouxia sp. C0004]
MTMSQNQPLVPNVRERVASRLMLGTHSRKFPIPMLHPLRELTMASATLCKHAATCSESSPDAKLAARIQQIGAGGGTATSSQMSIASFTDKHKCLQAKTK